MSYFYWIAALAFAVLLDAVIETTASRNDD